MNIFEQPSTLAHPSIQCLVRVIQRQQGRLIASTRDDGGGIVVNVFSFDGLKAVVYLEHDFDAHEWNFLIILPHGFGRDNEVNLGCDLSRLETAITAHRKANPPRYGVK